MSRLASTFERLRAQRRVALMPYLCIGHPTPDAVLNIVPRAEAAGADLFELGVPFSDPLADGATIQAATQRALEQGASLDVCLSQARALRERGVQAPFTFMGYYNPMYQRGLDRFCGQAADAGVDGLIVPDLPPEEAHDLAQAARQHSVDLVFLLAPTSTDARVRLVCQQASGFLYLVSLVGVTGARDSLPPDLERFVERVRAQTSLPLAVGFGIGDPVQAGRVARIADGVIVGSAVVRVADRAQDPPAAVAAFIGQLRAGIDQVAVPT
ncbi:MAG: tryptophan synthase subunit alpha [Anaerolineae bacterium]|nr:tryptophan synthase subunit alpha [Anaerolineae bacterium]